MSSHNIDCAGMSGESFCRHNIPDFDHTGDLTLEFLEAVLEPRGLDRSRECLG